MSHELEEQKVKNTSLENKFFLVVIVIIAVVLALSLIIFTFYNKYNQEKELAKVTEAKNKEILLSKSRLEDAFDNIKDLNDELNDLNSTKDRFFSIIAHDLKGPVGNLKQLSDILLNDIDMLEKDELKEFTEHISVSAKSTMALLENLLEWSRMQLGKVTYEPQHFQLNMIVNQVTGLLSVSALNKQIDLKSDIDNSIWVIADINMINTVIRNLTSNSIKFTPENGKIDIKAVNQGKFIEISVNDNGVGISEENKKRLFKIEENFTTKGTSNEKGTGLGLILCQEFVEKNGGRIWVESELGKGTSFIFILPAVPTNK
jgi:signal transduction histidine kinase